MTSPSEGVSDDDEWEEKIMMVELSGIIETDWIQQCGNKLKLVGVDTAQPFLQLDRYIFTGEFKDIAGTYMMFDERQHHEPDEASHTGTMYYRYRDPPVNLKYRCHTHKKLCMQRVFLSEKEENEGGDGEPQEESSENVSTSRPVQMETEDQTMEDSHAEKEASQDHNSMNSS